jgi:ABC-type multidrug transport system fused ATPase/permease subunit
MWAEPAEDARLLRNSHLQGRLFLAVVLFAIVGAFVLVGVSLAAGLYIPPTISWLGIGTFDGIDVGIFFMWASMFVLLSVNDGLQYQLRLGKTRVPRSRASDVWGFIVFTLLAVLWGALGLHRVMASRAVDPMYVNRLPSGLPAGSLQHGVVEVTTTYFVLVGIVLVLIVVARLFNPVDFDEYDRYCRKLLHLPPSREPAQ